MRGRCSPSPKLWRNGDNIYWDTDLRYKRTIRASTHWCIKQFKCHNSNDGSANWWAMTLILSTNPAFLMGRPMLYLEWPEYPVMPCSLNHIHNLSYGKPSGKLTTISQAEFPRLPLSLKTSDNIPISGLKMDCYCLKGGYGFLQTQLYNLL